MAEVGVIVSSLISAVCGGGLLYCFKSLNLEKALVSEMQATPVLTPSSALNRAKQGSLNFQPHPLNPSEYITKAFVEGIIDCKHPIKSRINGKTDLIYSKTFTRDSHSNDSLYEFSGKSYYGWKKNISVKAPLYFTLKDAISNDICVVRKNPDVEIQKELDLIAEKEHLKKLTPFEELLIDIGRFFGMFGLLIPNLPFFSLFKGIKIGWTEYEYGIAVGDGLIVYGELVYNAVEKTLRFETPLAYAEKSHLLEQLKNVVTDTKILMGFLMIPFVISTGYLVKTIVDKYQKKDGNNIRRAN